MKGETQTEAQDALRTLATLDRGGLATEWVAAFGCPPPRNSQAPLLRGALAWHAQMRDLKKSGGSVEASRLIRDLQRGSRPATLASELRPGTRLLREWQGQTHHVTVLASGFVYGGKNYKSLTAIARRITGSAWSGPLFFGLRR